MQAASFWAVFGAAVLLMGIAVAALALGVIFKRPCLRGSCGGPKVRGRNSEPSSCATCPNRDAR